ncbi:AbrB/MazE/SpoVT family DNA-binding domain-containing protein [Sandaracinobacteroides hominis]|uniref:AbrB/MazE/SpoVT family DNA-binding domain-containing protein n=1 Tax=Sandaracinobacteroides hominis TaxID=2780086 RepID=UPI0018F32029|nr:AbrB/MazE/SpoVT family DNA-binding domain-containing protein [Sandaracinobacteroides hominis]
MGVPRSTKVFKSGNSKAVRLPADYPLELGQEVIVREEQGRYVIEPVRSARARALDDLYGSVPGLKPIPPEDREFEERKLDWHLLGIKLD